VSDPRVEQYAKLLVETCVDVQPGWQVLVTGSYLARPLLEAVSSEVGRRGDSDGHLADLQHPQGGHCNNRDILLRQKRPLR